MRQSIAAGVNITYKILFNDAVAMTGGQPIDGTLKVPEMTRELDAEGAKRVVVVTDEPEKYEPSEIKSRLAPGVTVHHRDDLDAVQKELREVRGCTVIVYDQTCATEKRRRRKRGTMEDPARRVVINELVCEGCGDCSVQSNCLSVEPIETEFGRKRRINQNTCNKDYSCLKGFCPSFVTVEGGKLKSGKKGGGSSRPKLSSVGTPPDPVLPVAERPWGIVVAGVGGTGVITIGQLLGMAAHLEGKGIVTQDCRRPGAEGRRDLEPHPDRQSPRGDLLHQGRHRRGRPGDRLRSDRRRRPGLARGDARRPHLRRPQHPRDADRRLRQRPRLAVPGRAVRIAGARGGRSRAHRQARRRYARGAARSATRSTPTR